jgi:hypothetical protein
MEVSDQVHAPAAFTPWERSPGTYWIGGWVGPQSRSGRGGEDKNSPALPGIEARSPTRTP